MEFKPELAVYDQTDQGIRILEEERRRIARDLHDGPAQILTNVAMRLDIIQQLVDDNPEMAKAQLAQLHKRVGKTVNEIRHLIYNLRPLAIDEVGLLQAVKQLCRQCEKDWRVPVTLEVEDGLESAAIAPAKQVAMYRLVQEILNNVNKHAKANNIGIAFSRHGSILEVIIQDDGKGFNPDDIPPGHYGLIGMKERAAYLGGELTISSVMGKGSTFIARVPVYSE